MFAIDSLRGCELNSLLVSLCLSLLPPLFILIIPIFLFVLTFNVLKAEASTEALRRGVLGLQRVHVQEHGRSF